MRIIPLLSWDFIAAGNRGWRADGSSYLCDAPMGVKLCVEPATKSEPLLVADRPWEGDTIGWSQVMFDDGRYRMWYSTYKPVEHLCYAESLDGMHWEKPELGIIEFEGSTQNNMCMEAKGCGHTCVFKDPSAPEHARYRAMLFTAWYEGEPGERLENDEGYRRLERKNAAKPGETFLPVSLKGAMFGLNSPDGLRWTPIEEPILEEWHDTHNLAAYDEQKEKYVGYFRGFYGGRRAVSYAETDDFEHWPPTEVVHHHLPQDDPDVSLYSNTYTRYPGRPDIHLMFPTLFHQRSDAVDVGLAVSLDGKNWVRHTDSPIIACGAEGASDEAFIYSEPDLLRFPDGRFRLLYRGGSLYHNANFLRERKDRAQPSHYAWAEWPEDRLAGMHAEGDGEFTILPQPCGERMLANYRTAPDGWIRLELTDRYIYPPQETPALEGFCFEDMEPLSGNCTHRLLSWKGGDALSVFREGRIAIRVRLHKATLFSITMYGADDDHVRGDPRYPV